MEPRPDAGAAAGPVALKDRALAPDLARGFMLLFIALVNAKFFLTSPETVVTAADKAVELVRSTLVDARAIPLFSLLFGYGTVQIIRRVDGGGDGWRQALGLLRRRGAWMVLIGLAHAVLFLPVDIIGAYGLALLLFVPLLRLKGRALLWSAAGTAAGSIAVNLALMAVVPVEDEGAVQAGSLLQDRFTAAAAERFSEWALYTPYTMLLVVLPPMLVGVWAGRRRILEEPARHRRLLAVTAGTGLAVAVAGGLPGALVWSGLWTGAAPSTAAVLGLVHDATGWAGGLGWAALIALAAWALEERRSTAAEVVQAVGQRSMTCYLMQSVVFSAVFAPYALGMSAHLGTAAAAAVAAATWSATAFAAAFMHARGARGPAEALLRRLAYGAEAR